MSQPAISVVVIGRNEGERLVRCLESVRTMSHPFGPIEIIYVDSCSSDDSSSRAADFGAQVVEIKNGRMSAARARNAGWQLTSAPFVLFLDGDTILHPEFAMRALAEVHNPKVMVVWGHRREIHPEVSIYNRVADLDWVCEPGWAEFCGGDALFRRSALEQTGGFNPDLIAGEEPDLCRRIRAAGGLILHIDEPMTGHDLAMKGWDQYWKHAVRAGHAYAEIASLYKGTEDPLWSKASRKNVIQVLTYVVALGGSLLALALLRSWLLVPFMLLTVAVLIVRTAMRARQKSSSFGLLLLFAVHSHVQQIPILVGQIRYWVNAKRNWRSELIEYKKPS